MYQIVKTNNSPVDAHQLNMNTQAQNHNIKNLASAERVKKVRGFFQPLRQKGGGEETVKTCKKWRFSNTMIALE